MNSFARDGSNEGEGIVLLMTTIVPVVKIAKL
jgi:hypothetical protein